VCGYVRARACVCVCVGAALIHRVCRRRGCVVQDLGVAARHSGAPCWGQAGRRNGLNLCLCFSGKTWAEHCGAGLRHGADMFAAVHATPLLVAVAADGRAGRHRYGLRGVWPPHSCSVRCLGTVWVSALTGGGAAGRATAALPLLGARRRPRSRHLLNR
jgi:hypothetical protein